MLRNLILYRMRFLANKLILRLPLIPSLLLRILVKSVIGLIEPSVSLKLLRILQFI
jgi:hypothetical protein